MDLNEHISPHFRLSEFLVSQTATRHGIDMTPNDEVIANITALCEELLEPFRKDVDSPIIISSGFRPEALNTMIGGSKTSAHRFGRAVDFTVIGMSPRAVCLHARDMRLPYDQNIHEFAKWIHWGIAQLTTGNRFQDLTAYRKGGKVQYALGIQRIAENEA